MLYQNILVADDDSDFVLLLRTAFEYACVQASIASVPDGADAIRYLNGEELYGNRHDYPMPDLILLDLRLPRLTGFDVLRWIRHSPKWAHLPVIILTGTYLRSEAEETWAEGASEFLIKPFDFLALTKMAEHIAETWLPEYRLQAR
jgi:CheY-like chemotaxis protein